MERLSANHGIAIGHVSRKQRAAIAMLSTMAGEDVACVDPDNGLVVPSAIGRPRESKHVLPEKLGYYARGPTVACHQHKARRKDPSLRQGEHGKIKRQRDLLSTAADVPIDKLAANAHVIPI